MTDYRSRSMWLDGVPGELAPRASLPGPIDLDVAVVGAGYTGLWTAYYLKRADPSLRIVMLEAQVSGFGASGRNGGWVTGFFSGPPRVYEARGGRAGFMALQRAMFETVDEVGRVVNEQAIEADFVKGGHLAVALGDAQAARLREHVHEGRARGLTVEDLRELDGGELEARLRIAGARGASFSPHAARIHPAKLAAGLASAVERLGVVIHEGTPVSEVRAREALTAAGAVSARWIVRATEGYTAALSGLERSLVPMNSSMIVTEPLSDRAWEQIGWGGREVVGDGAHVFVYLQRTEDGRIAIGGRGVPYRFGSRTDGAGETASATVETLRRKLTAMFPVTAGVQIDHAWSGVLGVPRDWSMSVDADLSSGIAWAGGYVGEGVAAANLAGRTLRDLITGNRSELTDLPWVGRRPRRWEPEPLRWSAIRGVYAAYRRADSIERRTAAPSRLGRLIDAASGRR